jgi:hypothetical protein
LRVLQVPKLSRLEHARPGAYMGVHRHRVALFGGRLTAASGNEAGVSTTGGTYDATAYISPTLLSLTPLVPGMSVTVHFLKTRLGVVIESIEARE